MVLSDFQDFYDGDNVEKVDQIAQHIFQQTEAVFAELNPTTLNLTLSGTESGYLRYFLSSKHPNLMFTFELEDLLSHNAGISISIELSRGLLLDKQVYKTIDFTQEEKDSTILLDAFYDNRNRILAKFATVELHPSAENIFNLKDYLLAILKHKNFISIFAKIEDKLTELAK